MGFVESYRIFVENGFRERVVLRVDGGCCFGFDVI